MKILVTGAAGFIGSFTASRFLGRGDEVFGLDNLNDYYDVSLKRARLARLEAHSAFRFIKLDLADQAGMETLFARERFQRVVHLGAQAGVRHSMLDPHSYVSSNIVGTLNVLEGCRRNGVGHLVYASTSSVYGASTRMPYSEHEPASHPLSFYGASKRSTELMAHSYSALFGVPTTGLRFFTVYGPWGRPDMALFLFARAIVAGQPISVFNNGQHKRDFTYVEDIAEGVVRVSATHRDDRLYLTVYNDGPSLPADWEATTKGVGLANLRTRLQILYGNAFGLQLRPVNTAGVEVVVTLPVRGAR